MPSASTSSSSSHSSNSSPSYKEAREVPGVPCFFFYQDGGKVVVLSRHKLRSQLFARTYGDEYSKCFWIKQAIAQCLTPENSIESLESRNRRSLTQIFNIRCLWFPKTNRPDMFKIVVVEGVLVAYSDYFVCVYSTKYGRWLLKFVAAVAGQYFVLEPGPNFMYVAELNWYGYGLMSTSICTMDEAILDPVSGVKRHLFIPKQVSQSGMPDEVKELYLCGHGNLCVKTMFGQHYWFKETTDGLCLRDKVLGGEFQIDWGTHEVLDCK